MAVRAADSRLLKEMDVMWAGLMADVSSQFKAPLGAIRCLTNALLQPDGEWNEAEIQDIVRAIYEKAQYMENRLDELLQLGLYENEELGLPGRGCRLAEVINSIRPRLEFLTRHHRLQISVPEDLPAVKAEPGRIAQVLAILVQNATRQSNYGISIGITAQRRSEYLLVSVSDEVVGDSFILPHPVLRGRCQVDNIAGARKIRTGLDLPVCRAIIEAHGGRIWVESRLGQGSRFMFVLPVNALND